MPYAVLLPQVDVVAHCGAPFSILLPVLTGAGDAVPGASITAARAQVRARLDDARVLHTFDSGDASIVIDDDGLTISASATVTAGWWSSWGVAIAVWDVEITIDGEAVQITAPGRFCLRGEVTR